MTTEDPGENTFTGVGGRIAPFDSFDYHAPTDVQLLKLDCLRDTAKAARGVVMTLPPSRERALAITALEESLMWACKAAFAPAAAPRPRPGDGAPHY